MKIYRLLPDNDHFHNFALSNGSKSEVFRRFDGRPMRDGWRPPAITAADTDDELALLADHALLGAIPLFSERAVQILGGVLDMCGELLPVDYPRKKYFAFNVTKLVDALDQKRS